MTTKPNLTRIWAEGAPGGNIEDPDVTSPGKFDAGWTAEIPPFQNFNFLQQLFTQALAHINEYGIPQWDTDTEYPLEGWTRSTVDNKIYQSNVPLNQGNEPSVSPTEWAIVEFGTPSGIIAMWSGLAANVPSGWLLCDGTLGTPNLIDKFIKGSNVAGTTGGSNTHVHGDTFSVDSHTLVTGEMPAHGHSLSPSIRASIGTDGNANRASGGADNGAVSVTSTGGSGSHGHGLSGSVSSASNEPEFYTLAFIIKV